MLSIVVGMLVTVLVAGLVVTYAAYPHRGLEVPGAPWLGALLDRVAARVSVLDSEDVEDRAADAAAERTPARR